MQSLRERLQWHEPGLRRVQLVSATVLCGFVLLLAWQLVVLATNGYPDHLLPVVRILSGTEQAVPVAYQWTIYFALVTVLGLVVSLLTLAAVVYLRKR